MKVVLLDLGGVVFNSTGKESSKINWSIISKLNEKYGYDLDIGKDLFSNFLEEYNQETNQNLEEEDFLKSIFDTLDFNNELVNFLKEKFKIVILSDNYRENINYISKRYNFSDWAYKEFYSFDFGKIKSDKSLFLDVLEKLDEKPENCIFIDDYEINIKNAKELGINGILFENNKKVFEKINQLKIAL